MAVSVKFIKSVPVSGITAEVVVSLLQASALVMTPDTIQAPQAL